MNRPILFASSLVIAASASLATAAVDNSVANAMNRAVEQPIAAPMNPTGDDQLVNGVVQALNGEASMKNSKITVVNDQGVVYLRGATLTRAQRQKATELAIAQAGDGNVVNVIQDDET